MKNMITVTIRPETAEDISAIEWLNLTAFRGDAEAILVNKLRKNKAFIRELSLAALKDGAVVGHILFFPLDIKDGKRTVKSLSLAPMAVLPEFQRQRIGSQLVTEGLKACKRLGHKSVIVLGHPEFYPKFGFLKASSFNIFFPLEVPDAAYMAHELEEGSLAGFVRGITVYPREFDLIPE